MTRFIVMIPMLMKDAAYLGSNGYQCDVAVGGAKVATSKPQFAAVFTTRDEAERAAKSVGGTVVAGTLVGFKFVAEVSS